MSVKLLTTEQIHADLGSIHNMWAGGIPPEQNDRVNALKAELKRRGVTGVTTQTQETRPGTVTTPRALADMTDEQLSKELLQLGERLGKDSSDEESQNRFADVRFELRTRAKAKPETNGNGSHVAAPREVLEARSTLDAQADRAAGLREAQARGFTDLEAAMRKAAFAKCAAECAMSILVKHADPNGDDIENACTVGLAVTENVFAKVGL